MLQRYLKGMRRERKFHDAKTVMGLDRYGFPAAPLANAILTGIEDYGDSTRKLEQSWYEWLHYYPFDVKVAEKLAGLYQKRLETLNPEKDAGETRRLEKKLELIKNRADRYRAALFPG